MLYYSLHFSLYHYRKLKATIDEYTIRVGQQAVVLVVTPGKPQNNFKVFGAHPLENVVSINKIFGKYFPLCLIQNCSSVLYFNLQAVITRLLI